MHSASDSRIRNSVTRTDADVELMDWAICSIR
jgi:hypothetical protein